MSLLKSFGQALQRSVEVARDETAKMMRMEISPTSKNQGALLIYALTQPAHLSNFATGSDSDIGGLSQCRLGLDESSRGRFYGTLSSQVPRGGKIEKSGYAGFRNRNRPTLFGNQCWDTTVHPYLALRVRNRLAKKPVAGAEKTGKNDGTSGLRAALHASDPSGPAASRAIHALGLGRKELPGPKFFVNVQTDGPVTSDLFQHRLYLDETKASDWHTVIIPFDDFVLTNTGQVSNSQVSMMREKIRTVGISAVLDVPVPPSASKPPSKDAPPSTLSRGSRQTEDEDDWAVDGDLKTNDGEEAMRGSKRGATFNFDLGLESIYAIGELEELDGLFQQ
ncbi:related to complex I intermediate-associated protein CIA30 precursor, mitochondrial [Melanopsichium pennsylvanicum]|uniref:Related to complex I intermediate-associated protein CIA30, mitochondrial n=2 Tax=Melanopsichium pennsylvanicum TaxID=63383 RepID=A0AAJ4XIM1_9BASI|nr:related to complex I intermediate-associated protein CIA30 precursor, mitochondrial [Melanopsichium pennsylvanicum 4]SNX83059.1 related to complex I intermediate-associated protein CIA30 precursor, mitochondrial [Melanopsichium pennsylvanicum]